MKFKLYNNKNKVAGTFHLSENYDLLGLQFSKSSDLSKAFRECVIEFLKKENLKIVSPQASCRAHYNNKTYKCSKLFGFYYRKRNPKTQKIEIKKIL